MLIGLSLVSNGKQERYKLWRVQCISKIVGPTRSLLMVSIRKLKAPISAAAGLVSAMYPSKVSGSVGRRRWLSRLQFPHALLPKPANVVLDNRHVFRGAEKK